MSTPVVALVARHQCPILRQLLPNERMSQPSVPSVAEVECSMLRELVRQKQMILALEKMNTEMKKEELEKEIANVNEKYCELEDVQASNEEQQSQFEQLIKWRTDLLLKRASQMSMERMLTGYATEKYNELDAKEKEVDARDVKLKEKMQSVNEKMLALTEEMKKMDASKEQKPSSSRLISVRHFKNDQN